MEQLILHLWGDYCVQSDWMAQNKRKHWWPALAHASAYAVFFASIAPWKPLAVIWLTHFLIDRYGLARYLVWAKNWLAPLRRRETKTEALARAKSEGRVSDGPVFVGSELGDFLDDYEANPRYIYATPSFAECEMTGYPPDRPAWLAVWLMIAADNTLHLAINYAALRWL